MRLSFGVAALVLTSVALRQIPPVSQQASSPQWQNVDQLCGTLQFVAPKKKAIRTANSKTETRLYANVLKDADVMVYKGAPSDAICCRTNTAAAHRKSNKFGRFELPGFQNGWYWFRVESNDFGATIPLHVTRDFNDKSCHDRSVGRIFTVDARPPKIEIRIY